MHSNATNMAEVPSDTFHAARQIYNLQQIYLSIGDQFQQIFATTNLPLFKSHVFLSVETTLRVALVTSFQYAEFISDTVAADASRKRLDWKYALHLPIHHQGVSANALCAFRQRLYASQQAQQEFAQITRQLGEIGLYGHMPEEFLSTTTILNTVCQINRLHILYTAMNDALVSLVANAPHWLVNTMPPYWYNRYKGGSRWQCKVTSRQEIAAEAIKLGNDMHLLLSALRKQNHTHLLQLPEIQFIIKLFAEQFSIDEGNEVWLPPKCAVVADAAATTCFCSKYPREG